MRANYQFPQRAYVKYANSNNNGRIVMWQRLKISPPSACIYTMGRLEDVIMFPVDNATTFRCSLLLKRQLSAMTVKIREEDV